MNEEMDEKRKPNNLRDILVNTETLELNVSIIILYLSFIILTICYAYRFNHKQELYQNNFIRRLLNSRMFICKP